MYAVFQWVIVDCIAPSQAFSLISQLSGITEFLQSLLLTLPDPW